MLLHYKSVCFAFLLYLLGNRCPSSSFANALMHPKSIRKESIQQRYRGHRIGAAAQDIPDECDVAIVGAGIGGLSCAAVLSARYNLNVQVFEAHYHVGGCAHSFPIKAPSSGASYEFDSGPTIILGCSSPPFNPLQQVLKSVGAESKVDWIPYDSWGMCTEGGNWRFQLGDRCFADGPLQRFGGPNAVREFENLRAACLPLCAGAASIPTMALRDDSFKLLPLLPHFKALQQVIPYSDVLEGSFEALMNEHVRDPWLRSWLDALAFSLSGLPAARTGAATMAYTLFDLHRDGASLDYPRGGVGRIGDVLREVIASTGSQVHLSQPVQQITTAPPSSSSSSSRRRADGVLLKSGRVVRARKGVICNADIWSLPKLLSPDAANQLQKDFEYECATKEMTKSFMHLHVGLNIEGIDEKKRSSWQPHYTVMDKGLHLPHDPCSDRNMVAVSNPSMLDASLVRGSDGQYDTNRIVLHAYGAGNEPYEDWERLAAAAAAAADGEVTAYGRSAAYTAAKDEGSAFLWRSISRALEMDEGEVKRRAEVAISGSPLTHQRFLRRTRGTYGAAWGSMRSGPTTPIPGLLLCGDSIFPGIGIPAVALSGANAANTLAGVVPHLLELLKG